MNEQCHNYHEALKLGKLWFPVSLLLFAAMFLTPVSRQLTPLLEHLPAFLARVLNRFSHFHRISPLNGYSLSVGLVAFPVMGLTKKETHSAFVAGNTSYV